MTQRILLLGKAGQLGRALSSALMQQHEVLAVSKADCDITDGRTLERLMRTFEPDVVVNAAAYTAVDEAERNRSLAFAVNADALSTLGELCQRTETILVHYSTDYVFDGVQSQPYTEADRSNPISVYGKSKWAGEESIRRTCDRHLILRTSWLFSGYGNNFLKSMLSLMQYDKKISVVNDQFGAPTSCDLVASVTADLLARLHVGQAANAEFGTYHVTAGGKASWFDYACFIASNASRFGHAIRVTPDQLLGVSAADYGRLAPRPRNSCLSTEKLVRAIGVNMPDWQTDVLRVLEALGK